MLGGWPHCLLHCTWSRNYAHWRQHCRFPSCDITLVGKAARDMVANCPLRFHRSHGSANMNSPGLWNRAQILHHTSLEVQMTPALGWRRTPLLSLCIRTVTLLQWQRLSDLLGTWLKMLVPHSKGTCSFTMVELFLCFWTLVVLGFVLLQLF